MSSTDGVDVRDDRQDRLQVVYDADGDVHARRRRLVVLATLPNKVGGLLPQVF